MNPRSIMKWIESITPHGEEQEDGSEVHLESPSPEEPNRNPNLEEQEGASISLIEECILLLSEHPLGLSIEKIEIAYLVKFRTPMPFDLTKFQNLQHLITQNPKVFKSVENSPLGEPILFLNNGNDLKEEYDISRMFHLTWSGIKHLLPLHSYVLSLDKIPPLLSQYLEIHVDPTDWCYIFQHSYYEHCIQQFEDEQGSESMFIYPNIQDPSASSEVLVWGHLESTLSQEYVKRRSEAIERYDEEITHQRMVAGYNKILERGNFCNLIRIGLNCMGGLIKEGAYHLCLGATLYTPGDFYVNPLPTWNNLEALMKEMQSYYRMEDKGAQATIPWKDHLIPGFILAAKCKEEREYHRAKVLGPDPDKEGDNYKVFLIDYGDTESVPYKKLRYLPIRFFEKLKPQSIRCQALSGDGNQWKDKHGKIFRDLIFDKTLAIHFLKKMMIQDEVTWQVFIHLYSEIGDKITSFHIERQVSNKGIGLVTRTDKDEKVEISGFRTKDITGKVVSSNEPSI